MWPGAGAPGTQGLGGDWSQELVYRVTCNSHCGEGILAHYVPRGALLVGRGSGMEASIWRVEDSHLLILATLEAAFMLLEPFTVLW